MNMLDKLDRLEHDDMGCGAGYGSVCTCGLTEVRAAVHALVQTAAVVTDECPATDPLTDRLLSRLFTVLQPFRDAQD